MGVQAVRSEPVSGGWAPEFPVKQGKKQGILTYLANMAELLAESIRQINRLAENSLKTEQGI
jgi:hypothetical protein